MTSSTPPSRPLIGVPTQTLQSLGQHAVSAEVPPSWVMSQRYVRTLGAAGGLPVMLPLLTHDVDTLRATYERLDGLFLPGGADVDPTSYGEERHPKTDSRTDVHRDSLEMTMVRWAIEEGKPVLGVCRGLQIINLVMGGTLYQDIGEQFPSAEKHDYFPFDGRYQRDHLAHEVTVEGGSRLAAVLGTTQLPVNSMHHQAARTTGDGLLVTARAPDGVIEGLEGANGAFLVAVQWHPEALTERDPRMWQLFEAFVGEAAIRQREQLVR